MQDEKVCRMKIWNQLFSKYDLLYLYIWQGRQIQDIISLPSLAQLSRHVKRQHIKMAALQDVGSLEALCLECVFSLDFHHYHIEHENCLWRFKKHGFPSLFSLEALYYSIRVFMGMFLHTEEITGIPEFELLFCKEAALIYLRSLDYQL